MAFQAILKSIWDLWYWLEYIPTNHDAIVRFKNHIVWTVDTLISHPGYQIEQNRTNLSSNSIERNRMKIKRLKGLCHATVSIFLKS